MCFVDDLWMIVIWAWRSEGDCDFRPIRAGSFFWLVQTYRCGSIFGLVPIACIDADFNMYRWKTAPITVGNRHN